MRITQWGEYGILISAFLAERFAAGAPVVGAAEIAEAQGIQLQYAQQILLRLREGGIVQSIRGPGGGYRLSRGASEINLHDILIAAEGGTFEIICESKPLNAERCHSQTKCNLRPVWYGLREQVDTYLRRFTLEHVMATDESGDAPIQIGGKREEEQERAEAPTT
ncbi:MAG: Rrf2 family transcriptional regulator [Bdellovibrionales bacterium]|nr:Rrf2 family transcriptional regulator [Bdellovibrionales bacterium]